MLFVSFLYPFLFEAHLVPLILLLVFLVFLSVYIFLFCFSLILCNYFPLLSCALCFACFPLLSCALCFACFLPFVLWSALFLLLLHDECN